MRRVDGAGSMRRWVRCAAVLVAGLMGSGMLSGCLVAGYSSRGGAFIWPGGLGLLVVVLLLFFLLRGRR